MKKYQILILTFYAFIVVLSIITIVGDIFRLDFSVLLNNISILERFTFSIILLTISITSMLLFMIMLIANGYRREINRQLNNILNNREVSASEDSELTKTFRALSRKMGQMTRSLQDIKNTNLQAREDIVKQERLRIARDLHDTVSQELFAATMMTSGLSMSAEQLTPEQMRAQLKTIEGILNQSQNDLRILLLHLRPIELEGKSLSEGIQVLLKEIKEKSSIAVYFKEDVSTLPRRIEENLFRVVQEFISNTLKHGKASRIEVYLTQDATQVHLKLVDDGVGFNIEEHSKLSYGLRNIDERVKDLAGTLKWKSATGKGVQLDIRVPILKGLEEQDGEN